MSGKEGKAQGTLIGVSQESPATPAPISVPPKLLLPPSHQDSQWDAGKQPSPQEDGVLSQPTTVQSDSEGDVYLSLRELLQGTQNVCIRPKLMPQEYVLPKMAKGSCCD